MTTQQIILWTCAYAVALVAAVYFTRATSRRVIGALTGGVVVGLFVLAAIAGCEGLGWWRVPMAPTPYLRALFYLGLVVSSAPIYLVTWRTARRFGSRGLAVFIAIVAVIGPPRASLYAAMFPKWMSFSPGIAPVLADSACYIGIVAIGHAVMRLVAGPARQDRLARSPRPTV